MPPSTPCVSKVCLLQKRVRKAGFHTAFVLAEKIHSFHFEYRKGRIYICLCALQFPVFLSLPFSWKTFIILIGWCGDRAMLHKWGRFCSPGDIWWCLETVLVSQLGGKVLPASSIQRSGLMPLPYILDCTRQPPPEKNPKELSDLNVNNAEVKKPWDRGKKEESLKKCSQL